MKAFEDLKESAKKEPPKGIRFRHGSHCAVHLDIYSIFPRTDRIGHSVFVYDLQPVQRRGY